MKTLLTIASLALSACNQIAVPGSGNDQYVDWERPVPPGGVTFVDNGDGTGSFSCTDGCFF